MNRIFLSPRPVRCKRTMIRKHRFSFILLAALLTLLTAFVSFAKTTEVGPGIVIIPPEEELFSLVNGKRGQKNLSPLIWDEGLAKVAAVRASEIAVSYSHTRPDGSAPQTAYKEAEVYFSYAGENLAEGYEEAADVFDAWYRKGAQRENLLRKEFTHAAAAYYDRKNEDGTVTRYWIMEFMKPKAAPADAENAETAGGETGETVPEQTAAETVPGDDIPDTDTVRED